MSQFELLKLCKASLIRYEFMISSRLLIDDYLFDFKHGTKTAGIYSKSQIEKSNPNLKGTVVLYQGTYSRLFHAAMKDLDSSVLKGDFIDFGCGRGKVLLMALDYPLRKLHGVELSDKLVQEAEENLENYCAKKKKPPLLVFIWGMPVSIRFHQPLSYSFFISLLPGLFSNV